MRKVGPPLTTSQSIKKIKFKTDKTEVQILKPKASQFMWVCVAKAPIPLIKKTDPILTQQILGRLVL